MNAGDTTARELPAPLLPLVELALDLRWTWSHAADTLWRSLDENIWEATRNPWFTLMEVTASRLGELAADRAFLDRLGRLAEERRTYSGARSWCARSTPSFDGNLVAYFCMEFGLGEAVPLYAGGLGILAGDFLKAASDLGLPTVGIGILYQEGYFRQTVDRDGWQHEAYPYNDPMTMPIQPLRGADGAWIRVPLELAGRTLWLRAWLARVGRVSLYLLDANDPLNLPWDRGITAKLYGGGPEMRLLQELVLGVGGWRLLERLGLRPNIAHLNEGHAAFAVLERARSFMRDSPLSFAEALVATRAGNVFTTHTPVVAGFDRFDPQMIERNLLADGAWFSRARALRSRPARARTRERERRGGAVQHGVSGHARLRVRQRGQPGAWRGEPADLRRAVPAVAAPRGADRTCHQRRARPFVGLSHRGRAVDPGMWQGALARRASRRWSRSSRPSTTSSSGRFVPSSAASWWPACVAASSGSCRRLVLTWREQIADDCLDPGALTLGFARRFAEYKRPDLLAPRSRSPRPLADEPRTPGAARDRRQGASRPTSAARL